jgi:hypothetical protein
MGLLEGTVSQVGWNAEYVVAWRHPSLVSAPAGWMVIDVAGGFIEGPFSREDYAHLQATRAGLAGIVMHPVEDLLT